jgi:hypothetical protein
MAAAYATQLVRVPLPAAFASYLQHKGIHCSTLYTQCETRGKLNVYLRNYGCVLRPRDTQPVISAVKTTTTQWTVSCVPLLEAHKDCWATNSGLLGCAVQRFSWIEVQEKNTAIIFMADFRLKMELYLNTWRECFLPNPSYFRNNPLTLLHAK